MNEQHDQQPKAVPLSQDELDLLAVTEELEDLQHKQDRHRRRIIRIMAAVLAIAFILLAFNGILRLFGMPSYKLLFDSIQNAQNSQISHLRKSIVSVTADNRTGTGFFINNQISENGNSFEKSSSDERVILTNDHIIQDARQVEIGLKSQDKRQATRWRRWPEADLALVWINCDSNAEDLPGLELTEGDNTATVENKVGGTAITEGDPLTVIGNPLGLFQIVTRATYVGEIGSDRAGSLIMIRGPVFRGNSGSPVINADGKVIGILAAMADDGNQDPESAIGYVIPARIIREFLEMSR